MYNKNISYDYIGPGWNHEGISMEQRSQLANANIYRINTCRDWAELINLG